MIVLKLPRYSRAVPVLDVEEDFSIIGANANPRFDDADYAFTYRNRVAAWKIFYPSRRGGSTDNNAPIVPLGLDEDSWLAPRQRLWKNVAAFSDDDPYVNTCAEDYLWIAIQGFWQTPFVAANDDGDLPIAASLGVEDESPWLDGTKNWKCALQPVYDDVLATASAARSFVFII